MRSLLIGAALLVVACGPAGGESEILVYKTPTCGCCAKWVNYLRANGFAVRAVDLEQLTDVKREKHVPAELVACHTAVVAGYVVEGHVPVSDIQRLLNDRPEVTGIGVAGMPEGSPGMEGPNPETYEVVAFGPSGKYVFSRHEAQ